MEQKLLEYIQKDTDSERTILAMLAYDFKLSIVHADNRDQACLEIIHAYYNKEFEYDEISTSNNCN